jgi:hypothetical protein
MTDQLVTPHREDEDTTYCAVHPDRETGLRCNRCERYMCAQCAVQTPVGYRCRQCVREVDKTFFNAKTTDRLILFGVSAALGGVITFVSGLFFGWFLLVLLFVGLIAGPIIGEAAWRATGKRRIQYARPIVWAGTGLGGFIGALLFGLPWTLLLLAVMLAAMAGVRFQS